MVKNNETKRLRKRVGIALVILFIGFIVFSGYFLIFYPKQCEDSKCFLDARENCRRVTWIKDDAQASWLYEVKGNKGDLCKINIKLLKVKKGTIDMEKLQGKEMVCLVPMGDLSFPEKDISRCHGILKEEMQDLLIQRMHSYLLENIGEISKKFKGV